jgi:uncharacterized membrane protein YedE/YeeE
MLFGLLGGAIIGLAATLYWLGTGRVAGVSGILRGALREPGERADGIAFLGGLLAAGIVAAAVTSPATSNPYPLPVLIVAGVLVGLGTAIGGGCTSGHGVCGLSRLSLRSLVATATFVATAAATVSVVRLLSGGRLP